MKDEYDFSKAQRGRFFREAAVLAPPVHLDPEVLAFLSDNHIDPDIAMFDKFASVCRRQAFIDFERKPLIIIQETFDRLLHKRLRRAALLRRHTRQFSLLFRCQ